MDIISTIQEKLRGRYTNEQKAKIIKFQSLRFRQLQYVLFRIFFGSDLKSLAKLYYTDKWGAHQYTPHYEAHFSPIRKKKLNILEIGIGGYEDPEMGGGSLRTWRTYFPNSKIYGIDIYDKSAHDEKRIKTFKGSQVDEEFLSDVVNYIGDIDVIIDDGSHLNEHVIKTFIYLFPHLKDNGIYVIEDVQTSYWQHMGGSSTSLNTNETMMGFFKNLIDGLNFEEYEIENYDASYYDKHIVGIHFYHNMIFIEKGLNNEGSNLVKNGRFNS